MPERTEEPEPSSGGMITPGAELRVRGLSAWYGHAQALRDVELEVRGGEVVTLVGRNGAGKTTLLRSIMGLHAHCNGQVVLDGQDLSARPSHGRARAGLGWVQDDRGIYASLTVTENLTLPPIVSSAAWPLERVFETFPVLADRRAAWGTTLSGGEQQMLAIARVLRSGARVLLLDEPTEGLAPVIVARIAEILRSVVAEGLAVLLVEQNSRFATTVATRHYLLAQGQVVEHLTNDDFIRRRADLLEHLGM